METTVKLPIQATWQQRVGALPKDIREVISEKIEELILDTEFKLSIRNRLEMQELKEVQGENIHKKVIAYLSGKNKDKGNVSIGIIESLEEAAKLLKVFPANKEPIAIMYGDKEHKLDGPFRVTSNNETVGTLTITLGYQSNELSVSIKIAANLLESFLNFSQRALYDTQYVYFSGRSDVKNIRVNAASFRGKYLSYSGGSKVLIDDNTIAELISFIAK